MSVLNFMGYAGDASSLDSHLKIFQRLVNRYFGGQFEVNVGSSLFGYYGSRFQHFLGSDRKLLFSGALFKTGALKFASSQGEGSSLLYGIRGDVNFCYGASTSAVYGGPRSSITRGITFSKSSTIPLPGLLDIMGGNETQPVNFEASGDGGYAYNEDKKTVQLISALSVLLYWITAGCELAILFKYVNYAKPGPGQEESMVPHWIAYAEETLVSRLMGLIQTIEKAGAFSTWLTLLQLNSTKWWSKELQYNNWKLWLIVVSVLGAIAAVLLDVLGVF